MKWLDKERDSIIKRWKNNEVSLVDAARELTQLGFANAWAILEKM